MGVYVNPVALNGQKFESAVEAETAKAQWFADNATPIAEPSDDTVRDLSDDLRVLCVVFNSGFTAVAVVPKGDINELRRFRDDPNDPRLKLWMTMPLNVIEENIAQAYVGKVQGQVVAMASVNLDDICEGCLRAEHCEGTEEWCSCCGDDDSLDSVKHRRKSKARNNDWK